MFHITGCPGQSFVPVGQPEDAPKLPDTLRIALRLYAHDVRQPKHFVGQPTDACCPTGKPVSESYVKPWAGKVFMYDAICNLIFRYYNVLRKSFILNRILVRVLNRAPNRVFHCVFLVLVRVLIAFSYVLKSVLMVDNTLAYINQTLTSK